MPWKQTLDSLDVEGDQCVFQALGRAAVERGSNHVPRYDEEYVDTQVTARQIGFIEMMAKEISRRI